METPTIVKTTKDYMLLKVPLPRGFHFDVGPVRRNERLTKSEKWLWKIIQEGGRDLREGRVITAPSIKEAMRKYAKREWDS